MSSLPSSCCLPSHCCCQRFNKREAERRSDCKNKLKQLGMALHNYHETFHTFPPGWIANGGAVDGKPEESAYSWLVYSLPFYDASPLFKTISLNDPFQSEVAVKRQRWRGDKGLSKSPGTSLGEIVRPCFRCPSDLRSDIDTTSTVPALSTANYVGNFGVGIPRYGRHYGALLQGIFAENSRVRIRDIRDGTTNVILAGERRMVASGHTWTAGELEGPLNSYWLGFPRGTSPLAIVGSVTTGEYPPRDCDEATIKAHYLEGELNGQYELNGLGGKDGKGPKTLKFAGINKSLSGDLLKYRAPPQVSIGYSSHHPGGCQVLLGDGSVRFLDDNTATDVLLDLVRRADGTRWRDTEY